MTSLPAPRTPPSDEAPPLRWGVLGTGWIAERFLASLQRHPRQRIPAIGSPDAARAGEFADAFQAPRAYGSYAELVADPEVDVVYVATPHPAHHGCALLAIEAGKHVLVEKPLAIDAVEAQEIVDAAARRGVFCMEALWTLFLPRLDVVRQVLEAGMLGDVHTVVADMGEHFTHPHRILRADLAGGPLLDLGTYPVAFATWVLGAPATVHAAGQPHPAGVNGQVAAILTDADGNQSVVHTTLFGNTPTMATIAGTQGTLTLPGPFYQPGDVVVRTTGGETLAWSEEPVGHDALHVEAAAVARAIAAGDTESPLRSPADSVATIAVIDEIRRQLGIRFPQAAT
jgi:predicted dehydrogenase